MPVLCKAKNTNQLHNYYVGYGKSEILYGGDWTRRVLRIGEKLYPVHRENVLRGLFRAYTGPQLVRFSEGVKNP